jgi:hypothetical protein
MLRESSLGACAVLLVSSAGCTGADPSRGEWGAVSLAAATAGQDILVPAYFGVSDQANPGNIQPNNPPADIPNSATSYQTLADWDVGQDTFLVTSAIVNCDCEIHGAWDPQQGCLANDPAAGAIQGGPCALADGSAGGKRGNLGEWTRRLHDGGKAVFAYVSFREARQSADIRDDIDYWSYLASSASVALSTNVNFDGVFLDEAARGTDADLARAEALVDHIHLLDHFGYRGSSPARVIFNWGGYTSQLGRYVNCLANRGSFNMFVTFEDYHASYADFHEPDLGDPADPLYFLQFYKPDHFVNLIHDFSPWTGSMAAIVDKSHRLNAAHLYVTDGQQATNPWAHLPSWSALQYFNVEETILNNQGFPVSYPNGGTDSQAPDNCPPPADL